MSDPIREAFDQAVLSGSLDDIDAGTVRRVREAVFAVLAATPAPACDHDDEHENGRCRGCGAALSTTPAPDLARLRAIEEAARSVVAAHYSAGPNRIVRRDAAMLKLRRALEGAPHE